MNRTSLVLISMLCGVLIWTGARAVGADTQALLSWQGGVTGSAGGSTGGWEFDLSQPIVLTALGVWDIDRNGLNESHLVRIWTADLSQVVATGTVTAGGFGLEAWRWTVLATPVKLGPGSYVIGADYRTSVDVLSISATNAAFSSGITYVGTRYGPTGPPALSNPSFEQGIFGPNFKYEPVPEPALLQLPFLLGLGGAGMWWRRRRA